MKKWIYLLFIALIVVPLLLIWVFRSPATLYHEEKIRISQKSMQRALWNDENWKKWWPGTTPGAKGDAFAYNGFRYVMKRKDVSLISFFDRKGKLFRRCRIKFCTAYQGLHGCTLGSPSH